MNDTVAVTVTLLVTVSDEDTVAVALAAVELGKTLVRVEVVETVSVPKLVPADVLALYVIKVVPLNEPVLLDELKTAFDSPDELKVENTVELVAPKLRIWLIVTPLAPATVTVVGIFGCVVPSVVSANTDAPVTSVDSNRPVDPWLKLKARVVPIELVPVPSEIVRLIVLKVETVEPFVIFDPLKFPPRISMLLVEKSRETVARVVVVVPLVANVAPVKVDDCVKSLEISLRPDAVVIALVVTVEL